MTGWYDRWCETLTLKTFRSSSTKRHHIQAVALTLLSVLALVMLGRAHGHSPGLVLLIVPVMASAALGGIGTGFVATAVAGLGAALFLIPPLGSFSGGDALDHIRLAALVGTGVFASILSDLLRRAARRAHAAEQFNGVVLEALAEGVIAMDDRRRIRYLNERATELTGWRVEDAIGEPLDAVLSFVPTGAAKPAALVTNRASTAVGLLHPRDGRAIPVALDARPLRELEGGGLAVVIRDRSDALAAEDAERDRRAWEKRMHDVAAIAPGALYSFRRDADGRFSFPFATTAVEPLFGLTVSEFMASAEAVFARVEPSDVTRILEAGDESARTLSPWHIDFRVHHPTQGVLFVEGHSIPHREPDGSTLWQGVMTDVSERVRANRALAESEAKFRSYLEHAPDAVLVVSADNRLVDFNRAALELIGCGPEEMRSLRLEDIVPTDERTAMAMLREHERVGVPTVGEKPLQTRNRGQIWIRLRATRLADGRTLAYLHDITDRKATEEALAASEARFRSYIERAPDAVVVVARGGRFLDVNPATVRMTGYSVDELRQMAITDLVCPEDHAALSAERARLWAEGHMAGEYRITTRTGATNWVSIRASLLDNGTSLAYAHDITARRRAEAAIHESESRLKGIIESAMDGIVTVDEQQRVVMLNPAAEKMFGSTQGELRGQPVTVLIPEEARAHHDAHVARFLDNPASYLATNSLVVRGRRADGHEFPLEATLSQQCVGERRLLTVFLRDISARIRAQQALAESDQRFRQLAENIREVFWLADYETRKVLYISPAFESIWGRPVEDVYASFGNWTAALHPEDRQRVLAAFSRMGTGEYDEEYRIVRPDGTVRWIRDQAFPVREGDGRTTRLAGIAEDVTERRQLEQQLRQTQKMESVGLLAGGVAHDFNNLLTVIGGNVELMLLDLPEDGELRSLAAEIQAAGERAASLTRQLLAFSRQQMLEPQVLSLERVVADTEKMLKRLLGEDITLTTKLGPTTAYVNLDPGHLSQVIMNLAVNARDAMPKGGQLTIETDTLTRDAAYSATHPQVEPGSYLVLSLTDTGVGMTPEVCARVFEPFFTTKGPGRGTGLGLAVVHGIVEQSGGHIEVDSTPGVGTTFRLCFPAVAEPSATRDAKRPLPGAHGSETVLLVEDDDSVRRLGARALQSHGYTVHVARDGKHALELVASGALRPDVVVTDVVMPRMNGRELSENLRQLQSSLRVLFTSGYTDDAMIRYGVDRAEVDFLQKPYTPLSLVRKVREILDRA